MGPPNQADSTEFPNQLTLQGKLYKGKSRSIKLNSSLNLAVLCADKFSFTEDFTEDFTEEGKNLKEKFQNARNTAE